MCAPEAQPSNSVWAHPEPWRNSGPAQWIADDNSYSYAAIDAAGTKVSMTDHLLFALTRTRRAELRPGSGRGGVPSRPGFLQGAENLSISSAADHYPVDAGELYRSVRRRLEHSGLADRSRPRDLRLALFRMAQHALGAGDINEAEAEAVAEWLAGRPARTAALRSSGIRYRITRANAHPILAAILSGVGPSHRRGLVISVDLERLGIGRPRTGRGGALLPEGGEA